jgi:hypothetical protein
MRAIAVIIIILGLASLVFGILFVTNSGSARQEVADSIAPLPLDQLDARYDTVKVQYDQMRAAGAQPSIEYNYLAVQKTGLGLARANVGTADAILMYGLIDIIVGLGLILTGIGMLRKLQSQTT